MGGWVVFDYGGVLAANQPEEDRRALVSACGEDPDAGPAVDAFWSAYWRERPAYDRAELDQPAYWGRVLGRTPDGTELSRITRIDVAGWLHAQAGVLAVADSLAGAGADLALLSNAPHPLADAVDELNWMRRIPHRYYSCRLRAIKPDPAAYGAVLAALGTAAGTVTFVDDRPANVAGAAAVGMRAVLFTDPAALAADLGIEPAD